MHVEIVLRVTSHKGVAMKRPSKKVEEISEEVKYNAEAQIRSLQKTIDYDTKDYTVEIIVNKYMVWKDNDENELYVPDYQREFVWDIERQSKFIESVILGIPIPYIFTASLSGEIGNDLGRVEIVDGSQRIRTLAAFVNDELVLTGLKKLIEVNGFRFSDFDIARQRRIFRRSIRVIELSENADEETRRDLFERINTGSDELSDMEKRKGIDYGNFYQFLITCSNNSLFQELCPISKTKLKREEGVELVLRFFAYRSEYENFDGNVAKFLDDYMKRLKDTFDQALLQERFQSMLEFVEKNFTYGFRKNLGNKSVPRMRFEAISVGVSLALDEKRSLNIKNIGKWLDSREFKSLTQDDAGNRPQRLRGRIEFVKNKLLSKAE